MNASIRLNATRFGSLLAAGALLLTVWSGPAYGQGASVPAAAALRTAEQTTLISEEYRQFLKDQFGYTLPSAPTKGDFVKALAAVLNLEPSDKPNPFQDIKESSPYYKSALALYEKGILTQDRLDGDQPLTQSTAVYMAVKAAGLKELAYTYPAEKAARSLAKLLADDEIPQLTPQAAQELAAAADTELLPAGLHGAFQRNEPAPASYAEILLGRVLELQGLYKHELGRVSDPDILRKVRDAWNVQNLIQQPDLQTIVDKALQADLITGYNVKDDRYTPHFDSARSLTYGHSEIDHALQLIGLLRSENIDARVQLEPKTSAFIYLKEWGEPVQTDDYKVVKSDNGNYIAYAKEYDLSFEFATAGQKDRFQEIVLKYAKKNSEDQSGLIAHSWWQPLYYSRTELPDYKVIANNKITKGHYYAQTFSLADKPEAIAEGIRKISPATKVESYRFWVDEPFYNYLIGEYK
ncbi:hypothetical protein [Paenibacillus chitinolyticus]|uniref:hypothetical protein n=1 Tax=Paenibacillus chitinolyticus TaxID=79263 RepID=UPI001C467090|nr:hypothetical protein [Paenibacillus chitinolyticus]MBV6716998.1 hypothetical protein [Paenibacillus chitinolyticus]